MKEDAELVGGNHVEPSRSGIVRLTEGCPHGHECADECENARRLVTAARGQQRLNHHHDHAPDAQHELGQNADVTQIRVRGHLAVSVMARMCVRCAPAFVAEAALTEEGRSDCCTEGSIMRIHSGEATPIISATAMSGIRLMRSRPSASGSEAFTGSFTSP